MAVSGYGHPLMDELFPPGRWRKVLGPDKVNHSTKGTRREVLWVSFALRAEMGVSVSDMVSTSSAMACFQG